MLHIDLADATQDRFGHLLRLASGGGQKMQALSARMAGLLAGHAELVCQVRDGALPVSNGGTHDPENLIVLCSFHHLRYVHRLGWTADLDGTTGRVTWTNTRTGTTMSTMPHGSRPPPRRDPGLLPDWLAPPRSPPPDHLEPPRDPDPPASWTDTTPDTTPDTSWSAEQPTTASTPPPRRHLLPSGQRCLRRRPHGHGPDVPGRGSAR